MHSALPASVGGAADFLGWIAKSSVLQLAQQEASYENSYRDLCYLTCSYDQVRAALAYDVNIATRRRLLQFRLIHVISRQFDVLPLTL